MKKILVTGGAGYVGSALVPKLIERGYQVTVYDLMIYGENVIEKNKNLIMIKGDIRDQKLLEESLTNQDIVIHLACISNDPSFELNPNLGKSINLDSFDPLVRISKNSGIQRFIYASSSSVYGIKKEKNVHEKISLEPLTDYSKYKAECEKILRPYQSDDFTTVVVRPATVCGYSRRQRLDVVVNILTNLAYHKNEISIFGGNQLRPNIHIKDMVNAYIKLLEAPKDIIANQIFNVGYENQSVRQLANTVKDAVGKEVKLITTPSNDDRSYHISSKKIKEYLNFETEHNIYDAVKDLCKAFDNDLLLDSLNNELYFNIKRMQNISLK